MDPDRPDLFTVTAIVAAFAAALAVLVWILWATPAPREQPAGPSSGPTATVTWTAPRGAPAKVVLPGSWCPSPGERAATLDGTLMVCGTAGFARASRWERSR